MANEPGVAHKDPPDVPMADRDLSRCRKGVLWSQLPHLRPKPVTTPGTDGTAVTAQLVQFVGQLVNESRQARAEDRDRAEEKRAPKSVSSFFGEESCRQLCIICNVGEEANLPAIWHAIAGAGKKDRAAVEHAFSNTAHEMGMGSMVPIATPDLTKKIVGLRFAGDDVNNLGEGIQPFAILIRDHGSIGYMTTTEEDTTRQRNNEYDILTEGSVSTTLQDVTKISTTTTAKIPTDYTHLRALLQAYLVLLTTLFGADHVVTVAFQAFVRRYNNNEVVCRGQLQALFQGQGPGRLLRFIQLNMVAWFRKVRNTGTLPAVPDFDEALEKLTIHISSWAPELPSQYLLAPNTVAPFTMKSGTSTVISGLTNDTSKQSATDPPSVKKRLQVVNLARNVTLEPFGVIAAKLKINDAIAKAGEPPTITKNGITTPMCLSFHVRGTCWNSCPRNADHGAHTNADDAKLIAWCNKAFTA
jgi:hypothetical protein